MPARIPLSALLPDCAACMGLGFCIALLRSMLPCGRHFAATFWLDFFAVGAALILLQGYAVGSAAAGELRWYLVVAGFIGAAAADSLFAQCFARLRIRLFRPLCSAVKRLVTHLCTVHRRIVTQKTKKMRNKARKNPKKQLQSGQKVLYNSNVL